VGAKPGGVSAVSGFDDKEKCILQLLSRKGRLTKREIAQGCDFSRSTVTNVLSRLSRLSLLETANGSSRGGRRPGLVGLRDSVAHAVGIDIGTHFIRTVVTDVNGTVLASDVQEREPYNYETLEPPDIEGATARVLEKCSLDRSDIDAYGIGISGIIDERTGVCLFLNKVAEWRDFPVRDHYAEVFDTDHVYVRDSTNTMAAAEKRFGACKYDPDFVVVNIGMGMGASIYIDDTSITSKGRISGEIGHIDIAQSASMCCCGNTGCLESTSSGWAIASRVKGALDTGVVSSLSSFASTYLIRMKDIIDAALSGDKLAVSMLRDSAKQTAIGMSILINLLNPPKIVLVGGIVRGAGDLFVQALKRETQDHVLPWLRQDVHFTMGTLGEFDGAIGSAAVAIEESLTDILAQKVTTASA
jgi:predicted NBD/HSP70 family sugar kinase